MKVYVLRYIPWGDNSEILGVFPSIESVKTKIDYLTDTEGEGYDPDDLLYSEFEMEIEADSKVH